MSDNTPTAKPASSTETPTTAFGTSGQIEEPMRNFGYTVAAYSVLWAILIGFVLLTHAKQRALGKRLDELEAAMKAKEGLPLAECRPRRVHSRRRSRRHGHRLHPGCEKCES